MGSNWIPQYCLSVCFVLAILDLSTTNDMMLQYSPASNLTRIRRQAKGCDGFKCLKTHVCIDEEKLCDGIRDCEDGSDELYICAYKPVDCILPYYPEVGSWKIRGNNQAKPGEKVEVGTLLLFSCKEGYKLYEANSVIRCLAEGWNTDPPTCYELCPPLYSNNITKVECFDADKREINCTDAVSGSTAEFDCATYYELSDQSSTTRLCKEGRWNRPAPSCIPELCPPPYSDHVTKVECFDADRRQINCTDATSGSTAKFDCATYYELSDQYLTTRLCMKGRWNLPIPKCIRGLCPPLYSNNITKVKCSDGYNGEINCTNAVSRSIAKFDCATYYERSDQSSTIRFCKGGRWNRPAPSCIPVCGEKRVSAQPLIVNGTKVVKGDYPWVTAVYQKYHDQYVYVCGGSILSQRVIITAAQCVTNDYGDVIDKSIVAVGVGKYYNRYNDSRDTQAQYSEIEKIIKHGSFKADNQHFASDIALLVTKDTLLLSKTVQPVCFSDLPQIHLTPLLEGVVTGWGFTLAGNEPSDYLKEVTVPYKDDATCYQELPKEWADKYLSHDKLCAGPYNKSTAVCKGDSGGGLVFKDSQRNRYFIHGIVSVANKISGGCDIQVSTLYTKVATHYEWLKRQVAQYTL